MFILFCSKHLLNVLYPLHSKRSNSHVETSQPIRARYTFLSTTIHTMTSHLLFSCRCGIRSNWGGGSSDGGSWRSLHQLPVRSNFVDFSWLRFRHRWSPVLAGNCCSSVTSPSFYNLPLFLDFRFIAYVLFVCSGYFVALRCRAARGYTQLENVASENTVNHDTEPRSEDIKEA